jgi:ribonuclease HI
MGKLLELIVARQLTAWAESCNILADGHFGGRKGSGTEDAIFTLEHWIKAKWREGKRVAGLFLDVKSAYPSVHPERLIFYLSQQKCPTYLILMIDDFLRDRSTTIRLDDFISEAHRLEIGLPQGFPLSVILYILYNNSLLIKDFSPERDRVSIGYVDNVVHLVADESFEAAKKALVGEGVRSLDWGRTHGAIFDQAKAQFMWFSKGETPQEPLSFGSQTLKAATEVKWLGVFLDPKLSFARNFRALEDKISKTAGQLKIFGNSRRGSREAARARLIRCVLTPRLTYGAAVWATTANKGKVTALANKADRVAGIFSLGVFKSTSNQFISLRSSIPPIMDDILRTSFSFFFRKITTIKANNIIRRFILSSRSDSTGRLADSARTSLSYSMVDAAVQLKPETLHIAFDLNQLPSRNILYINLDQTKEEAIISVKYLLSTLSPQQDNLLIFSDGSFFPDKGGAGAAFCTQSNLFHTLSMGNNLTVSNHEAEAVGLIAASSLAEKLCHGRVIRKIVFFVDNKGVIIRTKNPGSPKPGQSLFKAIDKNLAALPPWAEIVMVWCPGHKDIPGNEMADKLAKEAVDNPASPSFTVQGNHRKITQLATAELRTCGAASPSLLPIAATSVINQLASGHCSLNYFLFRINRHFDPICPFCSGRDTPVHLLNFCPRFKTIRSDLRRSLRNLKIRFHPDRLDRVLHLRKADLPVARFLQLTGRFPALNIVS